MKTIWSVELEGNMWNDDSFNGTFEECIEYCKENNYKIDGKEARLAEIVVDDKNCVIDTIQIVEKI